MNMHRAIFRSGSAQTTNAPMVCGSTASINKVLHRSLHWRHNERDGVSNNHTQDCLLNRLFKRRSKKTPKLPDTGLCEGIHRSPVNSPHKGPVTWKMFSFDGIIMWFPFHINPSHWTKVGGWLSGFTDLINMKLVIALVRKIGRHIS